MAELSKSFPQGIEYKIQHDETEFVRESIKEVISAIALAVLLVGVVTYLFLGTARAAFIPICAIPVSLIGVFIFMNTHLILEVVGHDKNNFTCCVYTLFNLRFKAFEAFPHELNLIQ